MSSPVSNVLPTIDFHDLAGLSPSYRASSTITVEVAKWSLVVTAVKVITLPNILKISADSIPPKVIVSPAINPVTSASSISVTPVSASTATVVSDLGSI